MQNQIKPPTLDDSMSKEELSKRVAEMMAAENDMQPLDDSFLSNNAYISSY